MKPKKLDRATIETLARQATGDLGWVEAHAAEIAGHACDWMDDARQGVDYDQIRRGGQELTSPERHAEAALKGRTDDAQILVTNFRQALVDARRAASHLRDAGSALVRVPDTQNRNASSAAALSKRQPGAGECLVCGDYASGIGEDRLRSGRCDPCRQYRLRHDGQDRPREMWAKAG